MAKQEWCILDYERQPPSFLCLRCNQWHFTKLPASVKEVVAQTQAFCRLHKNCTDEDALFVESALKSLTVSISGLNTQPVTHAAAKPF